jgi:uncharacterized membrane protein YkoI
MGKLKNIILLSLIFFEHFGTSAYAQNESRFHSFFHRPIQQNRLYADQSSPKKIITSSEAKKIAEDRFGGEALSATFENGGSAGSVYRVKVIKGGRVKVVTIPANP